MKGNESKLTSAIKNIILANKNVEVIKEVLQEDPREMNVSVFDQVGQENQDVKYLDLFIHLTEQCLNNPNKSATLCTDLILKISYVISDPSKWVKHFNNKIQFQKNQIHEKINQFLSNCILLVENQKPVQKIIIMALTNLVTIDQPEDETLCESCLKTLKILYKNNPDLKQLLKKTIQKNILTNLEQQNFKNIPICLFRGLIDFASEIKLGDWMTDQQCILFGRWLEQIFVIFKDDKPAEKVEKTAKGADKVEKPEKNDKGEKIDQSVECTLSLMSKCFVAESFAGQLEEFITMDGVMNILLYCFNIPRKPKAEDAFTKNKIIVYIFEMISSLNRFLKKSGKSEKKVVYFEKVPSEIGKMIDELEIRKYNFAFSDFVDNSSHCQIVNKKLGALIRAYGKILIDDPEQTKIPPDPNPNDLKKKEKEQQNSQNDKNQDKKDEKPPVFIQVLKLMTIKKLDPYIYGSLCQFIVCIFGSSVGDLYLNTILSSTENFSHALNILSKSSYNEFMMMAKVYGNIQISQEHTLANMPTTELQYAVLQILKVFECIQRKALEPNSAQRFSDKLKQLEQFNYKNIILLCLEAPLEDIRVVAAFLLSNIPSKKWEFDDLKTMQRILEKLQQLLAESLGEEEISCLLMIFCNIVASNDNPVSYQFRASNASQNLCIVAYKILRTNMSRDTKGDESQTKQKIELSASCVFLLSQYLYSADLRVNLFNTKALVDIGEAIRLEDQYISDANKPISIESICLVIQPLFQALEYDLGLNITHLNYFRVLMQISNILNFQVYDAAQIGTHNRNEEEKRIIQQKEQMQSKNKQHQQKISNYEDNLFEERNETSEEILQAYKNQLYKQCCEQWNSWKIKKYPNYKQLELIDDLLSAFEVQHTIFSSQNGVDRLLACLQRQIIKNINLDLEERAIALTSIHQSEGTEYQSKVVTSSLSRHAIVSKLVGCPVNQELNISRFSSQFFEVVQSKKILANSLVDLSAFKEDDFYQYMGLQSSNKAKIALITSAFLYSCYVSIIFAPEASILFNALTEVQQKEKLIGFIKLCAASDWYNSCVSIKLFKIYRLIGHHMVLFFNADNGFEFQKFCQEEIVKQIKSTSEPPAVQDEKLKPIKANKKEIENKQKAFKKKPTFSAPKPEEYLETCQLINKTMLIIISDFKEIIQSLNKEQLLQQLKLINSIFKTVKIVFKQTLICVVDNKLNDYTTIFSAIRKIYKLIVAPNFFDELTLCMQKLDKKITSLSTVFQKEETKIKQQYKLYTNLAWVLGVLFIKKGQNLKQLFGNLCQRFDQPKLAETVNNGIKAWVIQMVLLHQFTWKDINNPFVSQIPIHEVMIDFKRQDGYTRFKNCLLLIFNTYFTVVEILGVQVNQDFLQTQVTQKNYKVHLHIQGQWIKECVCVSQQQMQQINQMTEEQKKDLQDNQEELNEGLKVMDISLMNMDEKSKKGDIEYLFYFETKWDCQKYVKLMNLLQLADSNFDNALI